MEPVKTQQAEIKKDEDEPMHTKVSCVSPPPVAMDLPKNGLKLSSLHERELLYAETKETCEGVL